MIIETVKESEVTVAGDTAAIGKHGDYPCRKVGGEWKYDLVSLHSKDPAMVLKGIAFDQKRAALDERFAKEIAEGKWQSFKEMMKAQ